MPNTTIRARLSDGSGLQIEVLHPSKALEFLPQGTRFRAWQIEPVPSTDEWAHYRMYQLLDEQSLANAFWGLEQTRFHTKMSPANLLAYYDLQDIYSCYLQGRYRLDNQDVPPSWLSGRQ